MTKETKENENLEREAETQPETVESLKQQLAAEKENALRVQADFENSRKRLQKRSDELVKYAIENLVSDILPVVDDLDRAVSSLNSGHDVKTVKQGLTLVQNTFHKILEQNGVKPIECLNGAFDPHLHEAVAEVENDRLEEGTVVEEVQKGYLLNGRLARPSRVKISKKSI